MNFGKELAVLERMTVAELRARYADVFGDATRTGNRTWLIKRITWRLQAQVEGDLSERARRRAAELANDADLRMSPPRLPRDGDAAPERTLTATLPRTSDNRLPPPGTILTREYKGTVVKVQVLSDGFEYVGEKFRSLSSVARAITGSHCNGFAFFALGREAVG